MDAQTKGMVDDLYQARKARLVHPEGTFDKGGRWYPSARENGSVSATHRSPSRAWPYSYLTACRTRRHCAELAARQYEYFAACVAEAREALAQATERAA